MYLRLHNFQVSFSNSEILNDFTDVTLVHDDFVNPFGTLNFEDSGISILKFLRIKDP